MDCKSPSAQGRKGGWDCARNWHREQLGLAVSRTPSRVCCVCVLLPEYGGLEPQIGQVGVMFTNPTPHPSQGERHVPHTLAARGTYGIYFGKYHQTDSQSILYFSNKLLYSLSLSF